MSTISWQERSTSCCWNSMKRGTLLLGTRNIVLW